MSEDVNENGPKAPTSARAPADDHLRMVEAILFAAEHPLSVADMALRLPQGVDVEGHLETLRITYVDRGVEIAIVAGRYQFRTAPDLAFLMRKEVVETRKLSRAAVETLAIIAYHQPVTRAGIEEIRGVGLSKGTLDLLMEAGWVRPRGRKRTPGRPLLYGTSDDFLIHFGLESLDDLPGVSELKATGMLDSVDDASARFEAEQAAQADGEAQADGAAEAEAADPDQAPLDPEADVGADAQGREQ